MTYDQLLEKAPQNKALEKGRRSKSMQNEVKE